MESGVTPLMFSVSIEQLDKKLKNWTEKINAFASNGGNGYKLKIDFGDAERVITQLKNLKIGDTSEVTRLQTAIDGVKDRLKEVNRTASANGISEEMDKSRRMVVDACADIGKALNGLQAARVSGRSLVLFKNTTQEVNEIKAFVSELSRLSDNPRLLGNTKYVGAMMAQYRNYMELIRLLKESFDNLGNAQVRQSFNAKKSQLVDIKSTEEAVYQLARLEKHIAGILSLQATANKLGLKTPDLDKLLSQMNAYKKDFEDILSNGGRLHDGSTAQMVKESGGYRALIPLLQQYTHETRVNIAARNAAAAAVGYLTSEEMRLAQYIGQSTSALHGQSQILSDLKSMAAQYISLWGAKSFVDNVIEKGGLLEQQRLSMGAILGDAAHAADIFSKVKALAIKSPFGVTELDQMTKQLSAYGFEYSELFDLSKRLADISAATGTEVSRLGLALGHVKSEAALTGYTLRQFSMANVPLLNKLAEKYGVTTSQIRKMVSRKEVGYTDVLGVLKAMTDQGGAFYEAQETMSQALNAKFKNLRDSYEIMFSEIAESKVGDSLKDVAGILTTVSRHWEELFAIVGTGIATFGGMKAYLALTNSLLGANATAVMGGIEAYRQSEAMNMRLARSYRDITLAENAMIASTNKWTLSERMAHTWIGRRLGLSRQLSDAQKYRITTTRQQIIYGNALALSERRQTTEDLARSVALGKISKAQARQSIILSDLSKAEKDAGIAAVNSVNTYGRMTGVVNGASMAFTKLGASLKSLFLSPQLWVFALLAGVTELWQKNKIEVERAKQLNDDLFNRAMEGIKNIRTMMENTGLTFKVNGVEVELGDVKDIINGKYTYKPSAEMSTQDMMAQIDEWTEFIKEYAATPNLILNNAIKDSNGNVRSIADQYDILAKSVTHVAEAYVYLKQVSSAIEFAENSTNGGWFNDSFTTNIDDYSNAVKKYNDKITELTVKHAQGIGTALGAAMSEKKFADAVIAANAAMVKSENRNLTDIDKLKLLIENQNDYTEAVKAFGDAVMNLDKGDKDRAGLLTVFYSRSNGTAAWYASEMHDAFNTMEADATTWANSLKAKLTEAGWSFSNLSEAQKQAIALAMAETVNKAEESTEGIRDKVKRLLSEKFGIQIDVNTVEVAARIAAMEQSLKDLVGHDWHIDIKTATNFNDVISKIRQDYKSAQDYFNNVKPLMIKMGVDVSGGMKELGVVQQTALVNAWKKEHPDKDATIFANMLADYDSYAKKLNDALGFTDATGISLSDPNSGGKTFKDKNPSKTDKELELWRKRINILERYRQELAQLEKLMTRAHAESKLKAEGDFAPLWSYFTNPNDFDASLDEAAKKIGTKTEERKVFVEGLGSKKSAEGLRVFKENTSHAVSELERLEKVMSENYETYKRWLDLTGDSELAARISGAVQNTSYADWLKNKMQEEMNKVGNQYSPDEVFAMSESEVKKFGENSAIYKIWDAWQENRLKVEKESAAAYENAIKNAQDYATQIAQINGELERQNELIRNNTKLTKEEKDAAISRNNASAQLKIMELSSDYKMLIDGVVTMTQKAAETIKSQYIDALDKSLASGAISAKTYADKIKEINEKVSALNKYKGDLFSFFTGGMEGLYRSKIERGRSKIEEGALTSNEELISVGKELVEIGLRGLDSMNLISKMVHGIDGIVQGGNSIFQNIKKMYSDIGINANSGALGVTDIIFSSMSAVSGGATKALDALMRGDSMGAASAVTEEAVGLISALNKKHDDNLSEEIEELKAVVDALEANTSAINRMRNRMFGYDTGASGLLNYYRSKYTGDDKVNAAMRDFYKSSDVSGYAQEIQNLNDEREKYMEMYNKEAKKKDESQEALAEYQSKIAELDDQIRYFTEDMANELWSIDIKSWADQFSDTLSTAFENGENMFEAFNDTAKSIMQSVVNEMMKIGIIEPFVGRLHDKLFGYTDKDGIFHSGIVSTDEISRNPNAASKKVLNEIQKFFKPGGEGSGMVEAALGYLEGIDELMRELGYSSGLKNGENGNTLSASVQGVTEQTADLLAGYVNALRQDVAIIRLLNESNYSDFISVYWNNYIDSVGGISNNISGIHDNTKAIVDMIKTGDGALYNAVASIEGKLSDVIFGIQRIHVE